MLQLNLRILSAAAFVASVLSGSLLALPAHADHDTIYFNYDSPVTVLARYEFTQGETLGVVSGAWSTSGGTFNSTSTATAIATIDYYEPDEWDRDCYLKSLRISSGIAPACSIRAAAALLASESFTCTRTAPTITKLLSPPQAPHTCAK